MNERNLINCRKKILSLLLPAVLISAPVQSVNALTCGDLNNDNVVNISDYIYEKSFILENQFSENSDINGDKSVNHSDLKILSNYFLGLISELPKKNQNGTDKKPFTVEIPVSDDVCIKADNTADEDSILNVAGYNAAIRRNVFLKFKTDAANLENVSDAQIEMKLARTANGNCEIKVYAYKSQWSESNPPSFEEASDYYGLCDIEITNHPNDAGSVIRFDVTDVIRENPQATEFNFVMVCDHPNNSDSLSNLALFYSGDAKEQEAQPPKLIVNCNDAYHPVEPVRADNENIRFELSGQSGRFLRITENGLAAQRNISPLTDAKFKEKTGFCGDDTVCFESVSKPGWYLCRKEGTSEVTLLPYENNETFCKNASFIKCKGFIDNTTSYQAFGLSGRWLTCTGSQLFISSVGTDSKKTTASFLIRSEKNVLVRDEFDGGELNTDIWKYNYPWSDHHNYSAIARPSQVAVRDGKLVLTATRVADDNWIKDDKGETGYTDNIGEKKWRKYSHLTGVVYLPFSRYPLNGNLYIEGKFRLPDKSGFWPAFWLNGNNSWPPEIDIFEYLSNTPEKIYVGIHRQDSSKSNGDGGAGWWINRTASFFQKEFHTYALDWGKTYINYYIDDVLVKSIEDRAYIDNQKNMYMIINLGVGGWAEEPKDSVGDNTTYECDYIRVYKY